MSNKVTHDSSLFLQPFHLFPEDFGFSYGVISPLPLPSAYSLLFLNEQHDHGIKAREKTCTGICFHGAVIVGDANSS